MIPPQFPVFTIGHSNHTLENFIALLKRLGIQALADVRSSPYSRHHSQFNKETLKKALDTQGLNYVYLGRELGGRTEDRSCYENGQIRYERVAQTELFQSGIERIIRGADQYHIALMCAEKDPIRCHRFLLVSRTLANHKVDIQHILADGQLESHSNALDRLLDEVKLPQRDLFRSREELLKEAFSIQEERVGYVDEKHSLQNSGEDL